MCPCRRATPSGHTARSRRRWRRSSTPGSFRLRSAATTRSRLPSFGRWRRDGPLALVQLDSHGDTWEQYFGQKFFHGTTFKRAVEEGVSTQALRCRRACAARCTAPRHRRRQGVGFTVLDDRRAARPRRRAYGKLVLIPSATGRCSCRSTSTSSTRRSRRGPARPRLVDSRRRKPLAFLRALARGQACRLRRRRGLASVRRAGLQTALAGGERRLRPAVIRAAPSAVRT